MDVIEKPKWSVEWKVEKYASDEDFAAGILAEEPTIIEGNLLLNEGITELWTLIASTGATKFDNTNAYLAVGNSATAAAATDTDLLGASKLYKAMDATWPQVTAQSCAWRSTFGSSEANFAWEEVSVANGSSGAAKNLNRKVQSLGTKGSGTTWTLTCTITLS